MNVKTLTIRGLPEEVHRVIRVMAAEEGISVNAMIISILKEEAQRTAIGEGK